jgi:acetyl esterase/lipase
MTLSCNLDLRLVYPALLSAGVDRSQFNGTIDVNGLTFQIEGAAAPVFQGSIIGSGWIVVEGPGITINSSGTFGGPIQGPVNLSGSMPGMNKSGAGFLSGNGGLGTVTTNSPDAAVSPGVRTPCCANGHTAGLLHTKSVSLGGPYEVDLFSDGSSDLLQVTGTVTLSGPLVVSIPAGTPVFGQAFTIIDNDGSDPVNGTFAGLAEGSIFGVGPYKFRITYRGGDGNDVVLTVVTDTTTAITSSSPSTTFGGQVTFTSTVSSGFGPPTGVVTFLDGNVTLGTGFLQSGVALFTTSTLAVGTHQIAAAYGGNAGFAASSSATPVAVTVARAPVTLAVHASQNPSKAGEDVVVNVVISSGNPQMPLSGAITIIENGLTLAQQTVAGNSLAVTVGGLSSGAHQLTVVFDGGANFEPASQTITQTVLQPSIRIDDASITEGDSGTRVVFVPVRLAARSSETITVNYHSHDGTAKAGEDYFAVDGTLTFAPGEIGKFIDVTVIGDTTFEGDETFGITLSDPVNGTLDGGSATVTIVNDDVSYKKSTFGFATIGNTQLMLDVDTPLAGNGPFPAIVWVGGSTSYAPGGDSPALRETARGYVVVIPAYRAAGQAVFPAQLDDLQAAIRWIRANAATLHVDAGHIGIWGGGAGGHLAALAGTNGDHATPASLAEGNALLSNRVQAVVDWAGPASLYLLQSDQTAIASCVPSYGDATSQPSILIGCALNSCTDAANAASPQSFISGDDAPILIMHGANDCIVPPAQSQRFYDALKAAHVDATLRILDGLGAFGSAWDASVPWSVVDAFLDAHLKGVSSRRRAAGH